MKRFFSRIQRKERHKVLQAEAKAVAKERSIFAGFSLQDDPLGVSKLLIEEARQKNGIKKKNYNCGYEEYNLDSIEKKLEAEIEQMKREFIKIKLGRPDSKILNSIPVNFGADNIKNLEDLSQITLKNSGEILIQAFDPNDVGIIFKNILGINSQWKLINAGNGLLRLTLPKLTREAREEAIKSVQEVYAEAQQIIRDICSDAYAEIREHYFKIPSYGIRETKRLKEVEGDFLDQAKSELNNKIKILLTD